MKYKGYDIIDTPKTGYYTPVVVTKINIAYAAGDGRCIATYSTEKKAIKVPMGEIISSGYVRLKDGTIVFVQTELEKDEYGNLMYKMLDIYPDALSFGYSFNFDLTEVLSCAEMFKGCATKIGAFTINTFDPEITKYALNFREMFAGCSETDCVTIGMEALNATNLTLDEYKARTKDMFVGCTSLVKINFVKITNETLRQALLNKNNLQCPSTVTINFTDDE